MAEGVAHLGRFSHFLMNLVALAWTDLTAVSEMESTMRRKNKDDAVYHNS